jgi:hypothetical protein
MFAKRRNPTKDIQMKPILLSILAVLCMAAAPAPSPAVKAAQVTAVYNMTTAAVSAPKAPAPVAAPAAAPAVVPAPVVAPTPNPTPVAVSDPAKVPPPTPVTPVVDGDTVTVGGLVANSAELVSALKTYRTAKTQQNQLAKHLAFMLALAALFKILLSVLKWTSDWWKSATAKNTIRVITIVLGMVVYVVSNLAMGMSWPSALLLSLAGPMAISINELFDIVMQLITKKPVPAPIVAGVKK